MTFYLPRQQPLAGRRVTYTIGGSVGNNGSGWLHNADIIITVDGDTTAPTLTPNMELVDDFRNVLLSGDIR